MDRSTVLRIQDIWVLFNCGDNLQSVPVANPAQAAEEALAATGAAVTVPAGRADAVPVVTLTTGGAVAMEDMDVAQN